MRTRDIKASIRTHARARIRAVLSAVVAAGALVSCTVLPGGGRDPAGDLSPRPSSGDSAPGRPSATAADSPAARSGPAGRAVGAFLGSGPEGVRLLRGMEEWLGGTDLRVGHTYLPGERWSDIEGPPGFLEPWARWRREEPGHLFVLNVPLQARNEAGLSDEEVRDLLVDGAAGRFDGHFRTLAERLVEHGLADTVLVPGWEMNGATYAHRCRPDPEAWKEYWRRVVTTMRAVPGQRFRFDFTPSRGPDAIPWTLCYPGDDVVDIIGMDAYDQPKGMPFEEQVREPFGLQAHIDFARRHGKPVSYPEWGLFRNGDNPEYVRGMLAWMERYKPVYETISDYCPHGVWRCRDNPEASAAYREALFSRPATPPSTPPSTPPARSEPASQRPRRSGPPRPPKPPRPASPPVPAQQPAAPRPWWERCWGIGPYCLRPDRLRGPAG
ncbi:glycoside hydrolase family 26 protein [Streptomyces albus]|uniref:glycoside hydrolase family 26 protein n=1 Tax=Streptomyces sp. NRRL F-5639 TaxID=1463867 RepID=UPI0004C8631E|nr:glycosyl hydrolase [Streptomyces sp. NRRL F-5639]